MLRVALVQLSDWLLRSRESCQWLHGDYHHSETVIHRYGYRRDGVVLALRQQLREQTSDSLDQLAQQNLAAWMIEHHPSRMNGAQERELSWLNYLVGGPQSGGGRATGSGITSFGWVALRKKSAPYTVKATIILGEQTATSILKQRTKNIALPSHTHQNRTHHKEKTVVSIAVDPESPESFRKRPKRRRWVKKNTHAG